MKRNHETSVREGNSFFFCELQAHLPELKREDCGSSQVLKYTPGLHVANA